MKGDGNVRNTFGCCRQFLRDFMKSNITFWEKDEVENDFRLGKVFDCNLSFHTSRRT